MRQLARLTGSELSSDPEGAVNFRPVKTGSADHTLRYGADLLVWNVRSQQPPAPEVSVVPFGAASEEGSEKWHIVLRDPEGGSPSLPTLVPGALRDRDAAQALQDAIAAAAVRSGTSGTLVVAGDGSMRAGDLVELAEMPSGEDGTLRSLTVTHVLAPDGGFRTGLTVEGAG